jgi:hypothetical protein
MRNNKCLLQLLNNYGITAMMLGDIIDVTYSTARNRIEISDFWTHEANMLCKHFNIPLADFVEILEGNKEMLKKYLIKT